MPTRISSTAILLGMNAVFLLVIICLLAYIMDDDLFSDRATPAHITEYDNKQPDNTNGITISSLNQRIEQSRPTTPATQDPRSISSSVQIEVDAATVDSRAVLAINRFKQMLEQDAQIYDETQAPESTIDNKLRSDIEYIKQYIRMKDKAQHNETTEPTLQQAKQVVVTDSAAPPDRYNKVIVENRSARQHSHSLAELLREVVESAENEQASSNTNRSGQQQYIASLKPAALERKNEMRTITVRPGDTLWKISTRAYGSGFAYERIYRANPHLTSPNEITTGETLRVPL